MSSDSSPSTGFILNLCPTGMMLSRRQSPHVPLTPAEIIADVDRCVALGANLIHIHARDENGKPHYDRDIYARIIAGIRELHPDLTLCVSLSGRHHQDFTCRTDPLMLSGDLRPDMGSLTLSSLNFYSQASVNAPDVVRRLAEMMVEKGIKPELEIFDLGMLNYARYLIDKGILQPPYYFNLLLGNIAGAQIAPAQLAALINDLPAESIWCVAGIGQQQMQANMLGLMFGDGVRVGLEDNPWYDRNREILARNVDLVKKVRTAADLLELVPAAPAAVRERLGITSPAPCQRTPPLHQFDR
jgi:3-keto-5-aminohexanoate cleavage enzyme